MEGLPNGSAIAINTTTASYPSSSAASPHLPQHHQQDSLQKPQHQQQQQHHGQVLPHTLPPLQPSNPVMQQGPYGSYPHTPRTPATPNTPSSASTMASYPPPPPQNAGRGSAYPMMGNSSYPQQPYPGASSSMMPQTTTAASHPQPIAPAPATAGGRAPPVLRPMPAGGVMPQAGMNSPYGQSPLMPQTSMLPESDPPTHVVGSQGRRGILPSAPGRPAAPAAGSAQAKNQIPQKDADGKFPCPHCTKTYLHAKHLKRHLLRHTGDRPYMCVLCHDTFSRSDILKRHFIKCSVRRGNPTGASHLSHPQAHVKKNAAAQQKALGTEGDVNHINNMGNMPAEGMVHPFGIIPASDGINNVANDQSQLSRSSSINRVTDDANRDRRSMTASVMGASTRPGSFEQSYNGNEVANNMTANINPQLANYSMPQNQNGMPMFGGSNSADWSTMFQAGAHPNYVNSIPPNAGQGQMQTVTKPEPNPGSDRAAGILGDHPTDSSFFPSWGIPSSYSDTYHQLSSKILNFLQSSPAGATTATSSFLDFYFHSDNVRNFLENYTHFHAHVSILHVPTFRALETHVGLLAAMCCVGACYSDRIPAANIREIMDLLKAALEGSSRMFASLLQVSGTETGFEWSSFGTNKTDIEELQAIMLTQVLFTWHGTPTQRDRARKTFPLIASSARKAGLLRLAASDESTYSPVHQPEFTVATHSASQFNWRVWVEQEKRIRIMYMIFVYDVALGLYFNTGPDFDPFQIRLPLPTDDAAWDAGDPNECAEALGLHGPDAAKARNPDGTQNSSQPQLHLVLKALLDSNHHIQPGSTNLFGKFILIHALLAIMRRAQLEGGSAILTRSGTPIPAQAWFVGARGSPTNSGRATPVDLGPGLLDVQTAKTLVTALDKFKSNWDHDMAIQFPPSPAVNPRRYGFTRDGIHFYWLATYLLKNTRTPDLQMAPDQRFGFVIHLLKSVKQWVLTDGASRGEELGSVGDIDASYGTKDVNLDMTQLFRPLPTARKSPGFAAAQAGGIQGQQ
ncbi:fungal-specific transcription factor domain-containing protein [Dichotomopilus funicola]|uniref:Fungal-specific transcription factor domain-containing protein n=1 Tax=Dichotomopilus funicola TaxID=1934379 RepID=A0AAN6ZNJ4_9PEZI|nr:fungal-specific transcription factor domain-containing protein [Dichotomopilus funicola]